MDELFTVRFKTYSGYGARMKKSGTQKTDVYAKSLGHARQIVENRYKYGHWGDNWGYITSVHPAKRLLQA